LPKGQQAKYVGSYGEYGSCTKTKLVKKTE